MKKIISVVLVLAMMLVVFAGCAENNNSKELVLYTWEGMFPQEVLDGFESETGIKISYQNFDYDETMLMNLQNANGGEYDLVIADDYIIETAIAENLVQKLDKSKISNFSSINPLFQGQFYDANDEYTVPYGAGVQTIVYNPEKIDIEVKGYADLWNDEFAGSIGMIGNSRVINGMALKVLGHSYNVEDTALIEEAGEKLKGLAPNVRLIKDDSLQDDLVSGEVNAAIMYTSQVTMAKLAKPELKVVYPSEGLGFGIMANFIPVNAPNADAAHKFIDYILRPEISAQCFEYLGYYCTNKDANELIADEYKEFLTIPEEFKSEDMEMIQNISAEADEVHAKVWIEFKTACGQ